jgi:putative tryptophan/tyrosine transport system substrate-binding protein
VAINIARRKFITAVGGVAFAWPLVARAQRQPMQVIGFLSASRRDLNPPIYDAFHDGLAATGFVEGTNVAIEYRFADLHAERLPSMAVDLVRRKVDVILATGGETAVLIAKGATATIPIVFATVYDPVEAGLVAHLNRPEGNATGVTGDAGPLGGKRLELLHEIAPGAVSVGLLVNPNSPDAEPDVAAVRAAGQKIGLQVHVFNVTSDLDIDSAFSELVKLRAGGLLVSPDTFFQGHRGAIFQLADRTRLPAVYYDRVYPANGGLMSYGASLVGMFRQAGDYVGRILKGAKPSDLPVLQPTRFELVINMKVAKAIALTIPQSFLATADEVIE